MQTDSRDLRERIVAARPQGHSAQEIARLFQVSKRSVERFWKKYLATGAVEPAQRGGYRRSPLEKHDRQRRRWIKEKADLTLARWLERIAPELGVQLGTTALWHRLERLGLSDKKNAARRRAKSPRSAGGPPKVAPRTKSWEARRLVFLDETGLNTKMTRLDGRATLGERCLARGPDGHWQTTTFIAARRHDRLSAPRLVEGPMDGSLFLAYVERVLCPDLPPQDLVIGDNLSSHQVSGVAEAIMARGAQLQYLPAYSPDLNPITKRSFAAVMACPRSLIHLL